MALGQRKTNMQKNEVEPCPHITHKNQLRWIVDLNVSAKTIKLLEENIEINLCDLGISKPFKDMTPTVQLTKKK